MQVAQKKKKQEAAKKPVDAGRGVKASSKMSVKDMMDEMDGFDDEEDDVSGVLCVCVCVCVCVCLCVCVCVCVCV